MKIKLNDKWTIKTAKELYTYTSGISKGSQFFGTGYPYLTFTEIFHNYFVPEVLTSLVQSNERERENCSIKRGDVFLTRTSETDDELGMSCVALKDYPNATFNGFTKRLRPLTDEVVPEYAGFYFRSPIFRAAVTSMSSIITRASLNEKMLDKLPICYPSKPIQQKIASILSAYDNLIQNYKKQIEALQTVASELYKEWFVRFRFPGWQNANFENGIPEGWKYLKLSEFGYEVESGNRPAGGIDDSLEDGIPSLGAESIDKLGYFDYSNVKLVPREFYDKMKRGHGKDNDILLYKDGAYIGKVTLFRNGFPFREYAVNEHVFLLRSNNKDYQNYLYFTLNMPQYFTQMQNLNRNAAQPGLARGDLDRIKILVPNEKVIEKFNKLINPMIDNIFSYSKQITNLTQQRDLLLPRLMSGKLEVLK